MMFHKAFAGWRPSWRNYLQCPDMDTHVECAPKLRQSEFGHSSAKGEGDVRKAETEVGSLAGRVPATGLTTNENVQERESSGEGTRRTVPVSSHTLRYRPSCPRFRSSTPTPPSRTPSLT